MAAMSTDDMIMSFDQYLMMIAEIKAKPPLEYWQPVSAAGG
jgi:hypothetical protein